MPLSYRAPLAQPQRLSRAVLALAGVRASLPLFIPASWGFHRDEFLYFAMGDHLQLLRMQFPPFIALAARTLDATTGTSLLATRLAAALAGALYLLVACLIARDLGGGRRPQVLTALGVLASPVFLRAGTLFQPVVFEQLWWLLAIWALVRLLREDAPAWWLALGGALGLAAMTKFSAAFFAAGVLVAVLASPRRAEWREPWPWHALGIAVLLGLPSLTGQMVWGWPFLEQARVLRESQLDRVSPLDFLGGQLLLLGAAAPLAVIGLAALLVGFAGERERATNAWRPLAWLVLTVAGCFLVFGGKHYYLAPVHGLLLAAGSLALEHWRRGRPLVPVLGAVTVAGGLLLLPIGVPVLEPASMAAYASRLGLVEATTTNTGGRLELPQDYADMLGWEEMVQAVAEVQRALPAEERARVTIVAENYGRAGALQHFGPRYGLPRPVSRAGDFYHWGPGDSVGDVFIIVGGTREDLAQLFREVTLARVTRNPRGVDEEREVPVFVVRGPLRDFRELWRALGPEWG